MVLNRHCIQGHDAFIRLSMNKRERETDRH
jgi:hypothetical protein